MNLDNKVFRFLDKKWILFPLIFFVSLAMFGWLQIEPTLLDPDSFYHAEMAELISGQGIIIDFPWLSQTILTNDFADQHLLYHLLLAPLTYFLDPLLAVKIASVVLNSLFLLLIAWYLKKQKIKYCWLYLLLLLTIGPFIMRLCLPKASPLALILLWLGIYCFERKKYLFLFLISFLYVWAHGGFLLLLVAAMIFAVVEYVDKKINHVRAILIIIAGFIAGLVINPYFPKNLIFYWHQVIQIGFINYKDEVRVGAEWYSYNIPDFIGATNLVWIFVVLALIIFIFYFKKQELPAKQWLALGLFLLIMTIRSRRFVEYFVPVAVIWISYAMNWFINSPYFSSQYQKLFASFNKNKILSYLLVIYLSVVIPFGIGNTFYSLKQETKKGFSFSLFQGAAEFMKNNIKPGEIIYHGKWDDFPILFYHDSNNYYLVGLDATFMYKYNKEQYWLWRHLSEGLVRDNISQTIVDNFHSHYVFFDKEEEETKLFRTYLVRDKQVQKVFEDERTAIYEIK